MKTLLGWIRMAALVLTCAALSELPGIKDGVQAIDRLYNPLFGIAAGVTALGFTMMMGGIVSMMMASGEPMRHEEVEAAIAHRRGIGEPAVWRASAHRVFGRAAGRQVANEASFSGMKEAWRSGEWRTDTAWRRLFIVGAGALLLFYGIFSVVLVLGPGPIKVMAAGAIGYATVMMVWGFARAGEIP